MRLRRAGPAGHSFLVVFLRDSPTSSQAHRSSSSRVGPKPRRSRKSSSIRERRLSNESIPKQSTKFRRELLKLLCHRCHGIGTFAAVAIASVVVVMHTSITYGANWLIRFLAVSKSRCRLPTDGSGPKRRRYPPPSLAALPSRSCVSPTQIPLTPVANVQPSTKKPSTGANWQSCLGSRATAAQTMMHATNSSPSRFRCSSRMHSLTAASPP
jgi:hypothetical protein